MPPPGVPPELMNPNVSPDKLADLDTSSRTGNGRVWSRTFIIILVVIVLVLAVAGWFFYRYVSNNSADDEPAEPEESSFRLTDY